MARKKKSATRKGAAAAARKKSSSVVEVIDLCNDDDSTTTTTPAAVATSTTTTTTNATTTNSNNNNNNEQQQEEVQTQQQPRALSSPLSAGRSFLASLSRLGKRVLSPGGNSIASPKKKIKTEGKSLATTSTGDDDDNAMQEEEDIVEVVDASQVASRQMTAVAASSRSGANNDDDDDDDDDDLQVVGTVGQVRLPHLRQDCTEHVFQQASVGNAPNRLAMNATCCDLCYCYVCDKPASECTQWKTGDGHANASNTSSYWKGQRQAIKNKSRGGSLPSSTTTTTGPSGAASRFGATGLTQQQQQQRHRPATTAHHRAVVSGTLARPLPNGYHFFSKCKSNDNHRRRRGYSNHNGCDRCFCYVCNRKKGECIKWNVHRHVSGKKNASNAAAWRNVRQHIEQERSSQGAAAAAAAAATVRLSGSGPFCPDNTRAQQDVHLTECRHCGWFSRFAHRNFEFYRHGYPGQPSTVMNYVSNTILIRHNNQQYCDIHPLGTLDWCHACGRVADERDFAKEQSAAVYTPDATDILLGTKTFPFRLHAHDPRQMPKYRSKWNENEWVYDEAEMQEELFKHRIGPHPTLDVLLASLPVVQENKIPTGDPRHGHDDDDGSSHRQPSLVETDALLIDDQKDLAILHGIQAVSPLSFGRSTDGSTQEFLGGDIAATWDSETATGTLTLRVFIKKLDPKMTVPPIEMAEFFGAWFGVYPLPLRDVCGILHPHKNKPETLSYDISLSVPPFTVDQGKLQKHRMRKKFLQAQDKSYLAMKEARPIKSLQQGEGMSKSAGGFCTNETDFSGIMTHFAREMLPDVLKSNRGYGISEFKSWIEYRFFGRTSHHREMTTGSTSEVLLPGYQSSRRRNSMLTPEDLVMATTTLAKSADATVNQAQSIDCIMDHLVNLGHASAPFVEGLAVELLPFQLQSLQWALEREQTPGGLQSFWCTKLPSIEQPNTELYYNTLVAKLSKSKPALVRGGILAEQMGLGKTVISLSLILCNPAPAFPASGAKTSAITDATASAEESGSATSEESDSATTAPTPFWDPDMQLDPNSNQKRGSILSRGTLVVCNVSLVGQWIDEAKSKLEDPGLVYSYHGSSRKRDPKVLSKNAIVVTTYETLASDATYHAKKGGKGGKGGNNYCPPCEQVRWWRIICDECHVLRNASSKTSAIMNITADHKWLVSGTPINTSVSDLSNQLKFLGLEDSAAMMGQFKKDVCNNGGGGRSGSRRRRYHSVEPERIGAFAFLMRSILMRHTQKMIYAGTEGTTLMSLPPMTEQVITVPFSAEDQTEYDALEAGAQEFYITFKGNNANNLGHHYLLLIQKLMPLRVACTGGHVPIDDESENDDEDEDMAADDKGDSDVDSQEVEVEEQMETDDDDTKKSGKEKKPQAFSKYAFTSKLDKLVEELKRVRDEDSTSKSLVFSQFNSTLKWLQQELPRHGFQFRTLSGEMSMKNRAKALHAFQNDPPTTIFLLSMRAGAVGINLTQANRVFIMEPCLNPAIEAQAIGRVHRLGQKRPVTITRLVMEDSVETRIREMLENKYGSSGMTAAAEAAAPTATDGDAGDDADESKSNKKTAPGSEGAVIGCLRTEKTAVVESEFDLLYGVEVEQEEEEKEEKEEVEGSGDAAMPDTIESLMASSI